MLLQFITSVLLSFGSWIEGKLRLICVKKGRFLILPPQKRKFRSMFFWIFDNSFLQKLWKKSPFRRGVNSENLRDLGKVWLFFDEAALIRFLRQLSLIFLWNHRFALSRSRHFTPLSKSFSLHNISRTY